MLGVLPCHAHSFSSSPTFSLKSTSRRTFLVEPKDESTPEAMATRIGQFVHPHHRGSNPTDVLASSITISVGAVAVELDSEELDGAKLDGAQSLCSADGAAFDGTVFDGTACDGTAFDWREEFNHGAAGLTTHSQ